LQDQAYDSWHGKVDEFQVWIVEHGGFDSPRRHRRGKVFPDRNGKLPAKIKYLLRKIIDHRLQRLGLEFPEDGLNCSLDLGRGISVGAVKDQFQRNWVAIVQALFPPAGDDNSRGQIIRREFYLAFNANCERPQVEDLT